MRYLIIDTHNIQMIPAIGTRFILRDHKGLPFKVLSDKESLAKFKEIWEHGGEYVKYYDEGKGGDNYEYKDRHWEEFKKTL